MPDTAPDEVAPPAAPSARHLLKQLVFGFIVPFIGLALLLALFSVIEEHFGFHEDLSKLMRLMLIGVYGVLVFLMVTRRKKN